MSTEPQGNFGRPQLAKLFERVRPVILETLHWVFGFMRIIANLVSSRAYFSVADLAGGNILGITCAIGRAEKI
jgi:hypothetical protein